jgi:hypothetical protein
MLNTIVLFCRALRLSVAYSAGLIAGGCINRRCDEVASSLRPSLIVAGTSTVTVLGSLADRVRSFPVAAAAACA